jgi:hypothetical protein
MCATKDKSKAALMVLGLCSFISYAVFHGLVGWYIFTFYSVLRDPWHLFAPSNPEADARLWACELIGLVIGGYAGAMTWLSHRVAQENVGFARRCVALASPVLMSGGLLTMLKHPNDWRTLAIYCIPGAVLGLATGLIAAARRNPWDLLLRGIGERQRENKSLAIAGGLGLRLAGLFGLLAFAFLVAAFSGPDGNSSEDLPILLNVFSYLGLTTLIAFAPPPRWNVLVSGLFINVPAVFLAVKLRDVAKSWAIPIIYLLLWLVYIASRPASGKDQNIKADGMNKAEPAWVQGR